MRNKMIFIIILSLMIFIPIQTNAASVNVALSCPASANKGDTISCNVNITSDVLVTGLSGKYTLGSSFTYVSFTPSNGFTTYSQSASGFAIGNNNGIKGTSQLVGIIKLKVNNAGTFSLHSLDASDDSFNSYSPTTKNATLKIKSSNNSLANLILSNGTLSPIFNANTTSYTATINAGNVVINATKGESNQTISGLGTKTLKYGKNTFQIVVAAENGTKKTYTIVITRPDNRSTNNNLKSLSTNQGNISFNKNTTTYNLNVNSNITAIKINAALEDSKASFISGSGPRTVNLNYGKNAVQIKIKAENGSTKIYTINVTRKDNRSSNNNLKSITLSNGKITFNKNTLQYSLIVPYEVSKLNIVATPEDAKSTVVVNNPSLIVGDNIITIVVTSENQQKKTYTINVKRLTKAEKLSANNKASLIEISGHDLDFKSDIYEYDITIKDEYALVYNITLEDSKSSYIIEGNENLKDGSVIKVVITSENGATKTYKFNISKKLEKKEKINNKYLLVSGVIGFVVGIIITLIITTLIRDKKKDYYNNVDNFNNM